MYEARARALAPLILLLAGTALAEEDMLAPPPECGDRCPADGLELTVTELEVPLEGLSVDEIDARWREATRDLQPAQPRLSDLGLCYRCGSNELAAGTSLRYELTIPLPSWQPSDALDPRDRSAILRYVAALQGRANRLAADHREALAAVAVLDRREAEIRDAVEAACRAALERDAELLKREGCVRAGQDGAVALDAITACSPRWKPPPSSSCRIRE